MCHLFQRYGGQKGATPKKSTFLFWSDFEKFFFHFTPYKILSTKYVTRFDGIWTISKLGGG